MRPGSLHIGTCSWKYPEWSIYPPDIDRKQYNFLKTYAVHFNTVEIDQWFWSLYAPGKIRLPNPRDVDRYTDAVASDFRFTIKAPNAITLTHFYSSGTQARQYPDLAGTPNPHFLSMELLGKFTASIEGMKPKLGLIMLQFEYLNRKKMGSVQEFIDRLGPFLQSLPGDIRFGIEIRNPNYITDAFAALLARHHVSYVLLQGYYMPPAWEVGQRIDLRVVDPYVIRLHGPDRSGIEKQAGGIWDRIVIDRTDELHRLAEHIAGHLSAGTSVYANVNNHFEGSAPLTIGRLKRILETYQ